ncbi:MAG: hypothetical protein PHS65_01385 [Arcobacteraceae bacterium]|nr:hypothetical protein [Arcobacteraceae bacterium]
MSLNINNFQSIEARQLIVMALIVEKNTQKLNNEYKKGLSIESLEKLKKLNEKIKDDLDFYNQFFDDSTFYS